MDWYKNSLYRLMKWYEGFNGPKSWPDAWASIIFIWLHVLNVLTVLLAYGRHAAKSKEWFTDAGTAMLTCVAIVAFPYGIYFVRVLQKMKKLADPDEWPFRTKRDYALIWYIIGSIVLFIGSIVYVAI
jgi:hypothetical protein